MSEHRAWVKWSVEESVSAEEFAKGKYSREHVWSFDGGLAVVASASPSVVPLPLSNPAGIDAEEAFVAAVSSCHLLTFLDLARRAGHHVTSYQDDAVGTMAKNEAGVRWVNAIVLKPKISYREGTAPAVEAERRLHEEAHHHCFIANSVKTEITVRQP